MGLFSRLQTAVKSFGSQTVSNSAGGEVARNYFNKNGFNPQKQLNGLTYKVIDKIGQSVSKYEPVVSKPNGEPYATHPFYNLYNNPNPIQKSPNYFNHLWAMVDEIYGETFWYKVRGENSNKIKQLYLLNPSQMQVMFESGEPVGYVLHRADGQQVPFTLDEVYHDKTPNPFNEFRGISAMEKAGTYIDIEAITSDFTLNYMRNSASPSGIVSLPNMDRNIFKQFVAQWREGYEGPENAGKTAFIRGGEASFKAVGATLKDIDQKITRDMAKEDVFMMFEIPKALLGSADGEGLGRGNVETLNYIFASEKVEPKLQRLDSIYTAIWADQPKSQGSGGVVKIAHANIIPEDKEYKLNVLDKLTNRVYTINEARALVDLDPLKDEQYNLLPSGAQAPAPAPTKSAKITLKKQLTKGEQIEAEHESKEHTRAERFKINDHYEKQMENAIANFARGQQQEVIGKINASSKAFDEWLFDIEKANKTLTGVLAPIAHELMEAQAEGVAIAISGEALAITPEIRSIVSHEIGEIAGTFNAETRANLEASLTEGNSKGESLTKLKKRVEAEYDGAKGYRAKRIAQTESARATNITAEMSYKANGYSKKEWFANPGACQFCQNLDGTVIEIGNEYAQVGGTVEGKDGGVMSVDYRDVQNPPIHPNCKCSINPVV